MKTKYVLKQGSGPFGPNFPLRSNKILLSLITSFLLVFLLSGSEAFATTYYVSPTGNDTSSGSASAPFKTIQKAADIVNPGDTVIVGDGTYTDTDGNDQIVTLNREGTSSGRITFQAENKWGAVLDCQNNTTNYGWVNLANARYVTIQGFEIKGCKNTGIHSNAGSGNYDINIVRNYIHDIARITSSSSGGWVGVYIGKGTYNFTVDSNLFHDIGRLNPNTTPSASEASCTSGGNIYCYNHDHAIYSYGRNQTIINNIFDEMTSGWAIQIAGGPSPDGPDWTIVNNTFYGDNPQRDGHIVIWTASGGVKPTNILVQNNISSGALTAFIRTSETAGSSTWQLKNNLVYGANLMSGTSTYTESGNIIGQNPQFVNAAGQDFHLQATSPAINKGAYITGYDYDADGKSIVGAPDIGAYEYAGGQADTTSPSVPTGLAAIAVSTSQIADQP